MQGKAAGHRRCTKQSDHDSRRLAVLRALSRFAREKFALRNAGTLDTPKALQLGAKRFAIEPRMLRRKGRLGGERFRVHADRLEQAEADPSDN